MRQYRISAKNNQQDILYLKGIISEMKNLLIGLTIRLEMVKEIHRTKEHNHQTEEKKRNEKLTVLL